jgi:hypothetical protein
VHAGGAHSLNRCPRELATIPTRPVAHLTSDRNLITERSIALLESPGTGLYRRPSGYSLGGLSKTLGPQNGRLNENRCPSNLSYGPTGGPQARLGGQEVPLGRQYDHMKAFIAFEGLEVAGYSDRTAASSSATAGITSLEKSAIEL